MFLSKAELEELSRHTGGGGASARRDGSAREPLSLSWARVTGHCPLARPGECRATVTHRARPDQSGA